MTHLLTCPRCKQRTLNSRSYGVSSLYRSKHHICVPCFHAEDEEIEEKGSNNLPDVLASYGPSNEWED